MSLSHWISHLSQSSEILTNAKQWPTFFTSHKVILLHLGCSAFLFRTSTYDGNGRMDKKLCTPDAKDRKSAKRPLDKVAQSLETAWMFACNKRYEDKRYQHVPAAFDHPEISWILDELLGCPMMQTSLSISELQTHRWSCLSKAPPLLSTLASAHGRMLQVNPTFQSCKPTEMYPSKSCKPRISGKKISTAPSGHVCNSHTTKVSKRP